MSIWVTTFCRESVASVTPQQLKEGIAKRLELLTYLCCPGEEEDANNLLQRLTIRNPSEKDHFTVFGLHVEGRLPIRVERWQGKDAKEEIDERLEMIDDVKDRAADRIRSWLRSSVETVAFDLALSHAEGMGWFLAIAGAAWLAEVGDGVVRADDGGWFVPKGNEVEWWE